MSGNPLDYDLVEFWNRLGTIGNEIFDLPEVDSFPGEDFRKVSICKIDTLVEGYGVDVDFVVHWIMLVKNKSVPSIRETSS